MLPILSWLSCINNMLESLTDLMPDLFRYMFQVEWAEVRRRLLAALRMPA